MSFDKKYDLPPTSDARTGYLVPAGKDSLPDTKVIIKKGKFKSGRELLFYKTIKN